MIAVLVWLAVAVPVAAKPGEDAAVAGWIETARLLPSGLELEAKLDSGAEHSSLHVEKRRYFRRDGVRWIRFTVEGQSGRRVAFERRLLRKAAIKQLSGRSSVRPVVAIEICLGAVSKRVEVNLVDRSGYDYALLVGRSFLADSFLVDTAAEALQNLACSEESS